MPEEMRLGRFAIQALCDAAGAFPEPMESAFPDVDDALLARLHAIMPETFAGDRWHLHFRGYLIRAERGPAIVVDAGVGPPGSPASSWAPAGGGLPTELAAAGVSRDDVGIVVLTHLHSDHVGWAVEHDGPSPAPFFPNATYVVQSADIEATSRAGDQVLHHVIEPLRAAGAIREVSGRATLGRDVTAIPTPGHTVGHQSVLVETEASALVVAGDVFVHPLQLAMPEQRYRYETDPALAARTRAELLAGAAQRPTTLACGHFPHPFTEAASR